jgi:hypothetical protein
MLLAKEKLGAYLRIYIMKASAIVGTFSQDDLRGVLNDLLEDIAVATAPTSEEMGSASLHPTTGQGMPAGEAK